MTLNDHNTKLSGDFLSLIQVFIPYHLVHKINLKHLIPDIPLHFHKEISAIQLAIEFQYQHESGCSTVHWECIFQFESERHQVGVASKDLQGIKGMIYLKFFFY